MNNFPFVSDIILRSNLDTTFDHIVDLLALSESRQYEDKPLLVSSLRKTIIIHNASVIEALLLWKLKKHCKTNKIQLPNEWKYYDITILHEINDSKQVISGFRKLEEKALDRLDFLRITDYCYSQKLISTTEIKDDIDKVRELRNRLHIGGLSTTEKEYTKENLEFCFSIAKKIKDLTSK